MNKENWEIKKLGEICDFIGGGTPNKKNKEFYQGSIPWATVSDMNFDIIRDTEFKITEDAVANSSTNIIPAGNIIIATRVGLGKVSILNMDCAINQDLKGVITKNWIEKHFLFYWFKGIANYIIQNGNGATVKGVTINFMKNIPLKIPPLNIQSDIVAELDILHRIKELQEQQLEEYDKLAKSTFHAMFGDPIDNEKGWEVGLLKDYTRKIGSGATPTGGNKNYKLEGISLIRSLNVYNGRFEYKDLAFIDKEQAKQLDNVKVELNDVLINITGASVARSCIVPSNVLPARVNQHVSIIRLKSSLNYIFMNSLFISEQFQRELLTMGRSNGATREAITKSQLENLFIPIPPLSLQNEFAERVEKIEAQKELVKQSMTETEQLINYTMDKYFG